MSENGTKMNGVLWFVAIFIPVCTFGLYIYEVFFQDNSTSFTNALIDPGKQSKAEEIYKKARRLEKEGKWEDAYLNYSLIVEAHQASVPDIAEAAQLRIVKLKTQMESFAPPVHLEIFTKNSPRSPWQKATSINSDRLYQLRLKTKTSLFLYGFQVGSQGDIQNIFPENDYGIYSYENPVVEGEYYLPSPAAAFQLDGEKGTEHFYLLFNNSPLENPRALLENHLANRKIYPHVITVKFEHR